MISDFQCQQTEEDAVGLIVITAIAVANIKELSSYLITENFIIVGKDIDLLVLLCQLVPKDLNMFLNKVRTAKVKDYFFNYNSFKHDRNILAFLHCFTGCDSTSGFASKINSNFKNQ